MISESSDFDYRRYAEAIESALKKVPVKNREVSIHAIHLETSLPYDLIEELLEKEKINFPDNVDRIVDHERGYYDKD